MKRAQQISIIGSGVVGKATGRGLAKLGHRVVFHDINENILKELSLEGYEIEKNVSHAVRLTSISFICVQTPTINGTTDLTFVKNAISSVATALSEKKAYHLIVVRSTLLPGTTRKTILPLLRKHSGLEPSKDYGVCYNPEFLREATALEDFLSPSRIVIGELDKKSGDQLEKLYSTLRAPIIRVDFDTAEMIKQVSNAFFATKISFFNEIYVICKKLGINDKIVSEVTSLDPRIGKYGVYGGQPFSGGCLPKDVKAFANFVKGIRANPDILEVVLRINSDLRKRLNKRAAK